MAVMNRIIVLAASAVLSACSGKAPDSSASATAAATGEAPAPASSTAAVALASRYTPLSACKLTKSAPDEDWSVSRCPAVGGYLVDLNYGDARDDLGIGRKGEKPVDLGLPTLGGGGFNTLGPAFEWRGRGEGDAFVPATLIVRDSVIEDSEKPERETALLAVVDLRQRCVTALVRPGPGQNEQARAIADGPRHACMPLGG